MFQITRTLWNIDDVIGAIEDWIIGRRRDQAEGDDGDDRDDGWNWWKIGGGLAGSIAESSIYVEVG
jgi:hypothetical protein